MTATALPEPRPKHRRRQRCTSGVQNVAVELFRLRERLRLRPNVAWIAKILRDEYRFRIGNCELQVMLEDFVRASDDRRRMRRLSSVEAFAQVWEFCLLVGSDPSTRWLARFMRQRALRFPIDDKLARRLHRTYRARPEFLKIVRRDFPSRAPHLRPAIGKGRPIGIIKRIPKLVREGHVPTQNLNTYSALQMLLALEPRLKPGRDGLVTTPHPPPIDVSDADSTADPGPGP
jgi:hypothetical protein